MSRENVELVRLGHALFNAGDWDAAFALWHIDAEYRDLQHGPDMPEVVNGHDGLRRIVALWADVYDEFGAEVYEYIDADPWVVCDTRWYGRGKGSDVATEVHVADAYEVRDGKIARATMSFPDTAAALQALGLAERALSQENPAVVRRVMRAFADEDLEAALEDIDPDAVLDWSSSDGPDSGLYAGHAAIGAFMQAREEALGERTVDSTELIVPATDTVVLVARIRERGRTSGAEVESRGAVVWTLRDGKIIRLKLYQSGDEALKAVGMEQ